MLAEKKINKISLETLLLLQKKINFNNTFNSSVQIQFLGNRLQEEFRYCN